MNLTDRYVLIIDSGTWYEENITSATLEGLEYDYHEAARAGRAAVVYDKEADAYIEL